MNNYKFGTRLISAFCVASDVKHGLVFLYDLDGSLLFTSDFVG